MGSWVALSLSLGSASGQEAGGKARQQRGLGMSVPLGPPAGCGHRAGLDDRISAEGPFSAPSQGITLPSTHCQHTARQDTVSLRQWLQPPPLPSGTGRTPSVPGRWEWVGGITAKQLRKQSPSPVAHMLGSPKPSRPRGPLTHTRPGVAMHTASFQPAPAPFDLGRGAPQRGPPGWSRRLCRAPAGPAPVPACVHHHPAQMWVRGQDAAARE